MEKLQKLKELYEDGFLTEAEYTRKKNEIIDAMMEGKDDDQERSHEEEGYRSNNQNPSRVTYSSQAAPSSASVASSSPPRPSGRVVMASGAPPSGRVVYVDVAAPKNQLGVTPTTVQTVGGKLLCTRCGEPIGTKVVEVDRKPYDSVCARLIQVGDGDLKMPIPSVADPAPIRTYKNRKGERDLAAIQKKNDEYEKKHNKQANKAKANLEKAKEQRAKQLEREKAKAAQK